MIVDKYKLEKISKFLKENRELLEENDFQKLYETFQLFHELKDTPILTYILISSGINPLERMEKIPESYGERLQEIKEIDIPANIKIIYDAAFSDCTSLKKVTFHEGLNKIYWRAFYNTDIKEIYIPDSVIGIGVAAFGGNLFLNKISVPKTLNTISPSAFKDCPNLDEIIFRGTIQDFFSDRALISTYSMMFGREDVFIHSIKCDDGYLTFDPENNRGFIIKN